MKKIKCCLIMCLLVCIFSNMAFAEVPTIIDHFGNDLKYTFGGWPMLLFVTGVFATPMIAQTDRSASNPFKNNSHLGTFNDVGDIVGSAYVVDPSTVVIYGIGRIIKNEKVTLTGETLFETVLLTEGVTGGFKLAFNRQRPNGGNYSFPSAHASRCFAFAAVLETMHGPLYGVPAYLAASAISFSRIGAHLHYVSDVFFGAVIGSAIGWGTASFHNKLMNDKYSIVPTAGDVKGLSFNYNF